MTVDVIKNILTKHLKWLRREKGGKYADLRRADLFRADLYNANLSAADLRSADLECANLRYANLCAANLCGANLQGVSLFAANLHGTALRNVTLCCADLRDANLQDADLRGANLYGAKLRGANLQGADLREANLCDAELPIELLNKVCPICCPDSGSFIGWKAAQGYIVKLMIEKGAKRLSAFGRKCRCSAATCLAIETIDGANTGLTEVASNYNSDFIYRIGETISVDDFDENRTHECASGIHFFITRQEAVEYLNLYF